MKSLTIKVVFKVDVKLDLYRAAYDEAIKHAPAVLEDLWWSQGKVSSEFIRPAYNIIYSLEAPTT